MNLVNPGLHKESASAAAAVGSNFVTTLAVINLHSVLKTGTFNCIPIGDGCLRTNCIPK